MSLISNPASANLSSSKLNTLAQAAMSCSIDPPSTASSSSTRRDSGYQAHEFEKNNAHPDVPDNNNHHNHNHNPYASSLTATTTSTNIGAQYSSSTALQYHSHNHPRHNHENAPSYNPGSHFSRRPGPPHPNSHSVAATNSNNGCDLPSPNSTTIVFGNGDSGGDGGDTNGIGYSNSSNGVGANSGSNSNNGSKGRIFRCTFPNCDMVFSRCEHLARHARKHTGEKPFQCVVPGCSRTFSRFDNMIQHTQTHTRNGTQPLASTITNCGANGNGRGRTRRANFRSISDPANTHIRRFKSALGIRLAEYCLLPTSNPLYSSLTLRPILSPHFANGSSGCPPAASASGVAATPTISVSSSKGLNSGVPMAAATTTTTSSTAAANSAASISVSPESSCDKGTHINRRRPSIEGCQQHQHYPHIKDTIIVNSSNYVATNTSDPPSSMAVDDHPPGSKKRRRQRKDSGFAVPDDEQRCSAYEQDNATPASSGSFGNDSINNIPVSAQSAAFGATPGSAGHSSVPTAGVNSEDGIIAAHYHNSAATFATNPAYSGGGGPPRRSYSQHQTQTVTQAPQLLHRNTFPARLNLSLSENGCSDVRNNGSNTSTGFDYHYGGGAAAYSNSTKSHNKPFNCLPESPISPQWENCIWSSSRSPPLSAPAYVTQYPQPPPLSYMHTSKDSCQTAHNTSSIHPHQYHHHYSHHDPVEAKKNWCPKYQRPMVGQQQGECQTTATGGAPTTTTNTAGPLWTISPIRYK